MPYIGNTPALDYISFAVQNFTVTAGTTVYTLDYSVSNENDIRLVINNVIQRPGASFAYSATGTTLTLTSATQSGDTMYAVFIGRAVQTVTPAANSITNSMIASDAAISTSKLGAGAVLQVVQTTSASSLTTTSASFVTLNLAATITPSSTSSKILMLFSTGAQNTNGANGCVITVFRGSIASGTNLGDSNFGFGNLDSASDGVLTSFSIVHLDSPNTTSATTYTPAGKAASGATLLTSFGGSRGSFILMEIAG